MRRQTRKGYVVSRRVNQAMPFVVARVAGLPGALLAGDSGASPVAFDIELEDRGVVYEPVDGGQGHGRIRKDAAPFSEWRIGGDSQGPSFVSRADQLEENAGLGLILGDVIPVRALSDSWRIPKAAVLPTSP